MSAPATTPAPGPHPTPGSPPTAPARQGPPSTPQRTQMFWRCVFPTLTLLNLGLGDWLRPLNPVLRTFVLATIAVPIVIYGLMPQLHKVRARVAARSSVH